ncbi:hypothetical protein RND71_009148 [Anisodus tanguticus]|uniref:Uncharacterized protein n=1 Tax=Anisodus tanguticus TaxID=243964 RepID=A0AAE1SEZ4_9SOLA|nr:hypothetical protein RND71_009148 [Anisodus tanguticus]
MFGLDDFPLLKASLMHRPLVASFVTLPKMEGNTPSFAGHLCVDKLRLQLQREMTASIRGRTDSDSGGDRDAFIAASRPLQMKIGTCEHSLAPFRGSQQQLEDIWDLKITKACKEKRDYDYDEECCASNEVYEYDYGHYNDEHKARSTHGSYGETNDPEEPYDDHHDLEGTSTYNSYSSCDEHSDEGIDLEYDDSEVSSAYDEG